MNLQIRYVRHITGNFVVTLPALGQSIAVLPEVMTRFLGIHPRAVLGSTTITELQAARIGFLPYGHHPRITADQSEVSGRELVTA